MSEAPMNLYHPSDAWLKSVVEKLVEDTRLTVGKKYLRESEIHEAYTYYVLTLLMYALGLRPTVDPLGLIKHISVETGYCLVSDKVSNPRRAYRLLKVPPFVHAQLKNYVRYLSVLKKKLAASPRSLRLSRAIGELLDGRGAQKVPFLFLLNPTASQALSIRPKMVEQYLESTLDLPANFGRHVLATEIGSTDCPYHYLEAVLGHCDHADHLFGKISLLEPRHVLSRFTDYSGEVLQKLGFEVVETPYRWSTSEEAQRTSHRGNVFQPGQIAHEIRARKRREISVLHHKIAKKAISGLTEQVENKKTVDEEHITAAVERIAKLCERLGASIRWSLRHFYGWLSQIRRKGVKVAARRILIPEQEPSPFGDKTLVQYDEACIIRNGFLGEMEDYSARFIKQSDKEQDEAEIAAFAIVSAALCGHLADEEQLESLLSTGNEVRLVGGQLMVWGVAPLGTKRSKSEIDEKIDQVWIADTITAPWLARVYAENIHERVDAEALKGFLSRLCRKLGLRGNLRPLKWIALQASSLLTIEQMGLVRELECGRLPSRCISKPVFARLLDGDPLRGMEPDDDELIASIIRSEPGSGRSDASSSIYDYLSFRRWFNRECTKIAKGKPAICDPVRGKVRYQAKYRVSAGKKKARLAELCEYRIAQGLAAVDEMPPIDKTLEAILCHTARLCSSGTQYKRNIAWNTVRKYSAIVLQGVTRVAVGKNFTCLDEAEYEEYYSLMLDRAAPQSRKSTLIALREFHFTLMDEYKVPGVDWSYIVGLCEWEFSDAIHSIDANYVFYNEYLTALRIIDSQSSIAPYIRTQLKAMLILGYRFGLRWSEGLYLKRKDLHFRNLGGGIKVRVRPHKLRPLKTRSAKRDIPSVGKLSEMERKVLMGLKSQSALNEGDDDSRLVFHNGADMDDVADRHLLSALANRALKIATGDRSVRFHHLRHTYASTLVSLALDPVAPDYGVWGLVRKRLLEPLLCGENAEENFSGNVSVQQVVGELWNTEEVGPGRIRVVSQLLGHSTAFSSLLHYTHVHPFLSRAIQIGSDCQESLTPMLVSAATGDKYETVRKRMQRHDAGTMPLPLDVVLSRKQKQFFQSNWEYTAPDERPLIEIDGDAPTPIASLNTLCSYLASDTLEQEAVTSLGMVLGLDLQRFQSSGVEAEKNTGFDRYAFLAAQGHGAGMFEEKPKTVRVTRAENARVRQFVPEMEKRISCLSVEGRGRLVMAIQMLSQTTDVADSLFVLGPLANPAEIEWVLHTLGLTDRGLDMVPVVDDGEADKKRIRLARENAKSWRKRRRAYTISGGTPRILVTHITVLRLIFLAYLYLEYNAESAPQAA